MTKKKEPKKSQKAKSEKKSALTEWQKRNIEFLKKKEAEKAEKKKRQEKLRLERKPKATDTDTKAEKVEEKALTAEEKKKAKEAKKEEARKAKEAKKLQKLEAKKEKTPLQKAIHHALPVIITATVILLISIFLVTPFSKKKIITVTGTSTVNQEEVIRDSGIKTSNYLFSLIFRHSIYEKNIISKNKMVKSAKFTYRFPNKLNINVKEYSIIAYAQTDDGYQPILENGTRIGLVGASELPDSFLTINLSSEKDVQKLVKAFSKLDKDLVNQIQIVSSADSATTSDLLKLEMHDGNVVRVPLSEVAKKLPYYLKIKDSLPENSIVDMEVGIYATSESIEASVAVDKEKAKNENKEESESDSKSDEENSQTESSEEATATKSSEAEGAENQAPEATNEEHPNETAVVEQVAQQ
ncbi:cell division protein FtsQ [Streptococcus infantarius subsp. infantarius]|uniref:cell division protein FtsQ/DivIB n=1 Tax=Streptococcus infantarius TaxID=102684 RepID=UPI00208FACCD|nr:FtsQ-type POTRA domain-containing protein [Streptococcus infantarius]MCO4646494.1 cell division protein FtsQ [Streptococcus infantarius subsp. infantarius]MCO4658659.1 cell division protein FtsQ [Streptococcus infantarius subsp. infantarius]MCO4663417.1 cell division protein FtsQ [Streptococcus infantarius subsp. infantarius]MCO4671101.1 cell division protein FtsQ [Streptococcus infantarius subsp. infantarius]MCO4678441.1 cell division protein FtsQ [Streptococcus infantarius subsp. infantar